MVNEIYQKDGKGPKLARPVINREEYLALRNAPENANNFYDARGGNEKAKADQIQFCYNDLLPDGVVKGCCHPASTFAHDIDCGNEEEQTRIKDLLLAKKDEIGLLELSGSARWGLHAVCRRQVGNTIRECQYALSMATKTEYDTNARGLARVMFTGPATPDNLFFLDDAIFEESLTVEESAAEYQRLKDREKLNQEEVPPEAKKANKHYRPWEEWSKAPNEELRMKFASQGHTLEERTPHSQGENEEFASAQTQTSDIKPQSSKTYPKEYHGIPFEKILAKYWELNNNGFEPTEGDRDTLTFQLASDLRHICGKKFEWLDQVIPCYDGFPLEEKHTKIKNALASKYEGMPTRLRVVLDALEGRSQKDDGRCKTSDLSNDSKLSSLNSQLNSPPEMPVKLPKLIQLLVSKTPKVYQAAVANAVFPPLATHLCGVRFMYTDNVEHEATLMNCLMAGTGAGKGCIDKPIERIMADIERRDKENERREAEWKKDCQKRGANKDKQLRPEGLVIQIIDPDMTKPALVTRMDEAEGHFVYVKLNELDLFEQLKGSTGKQHFQLMCLAFDSDATYGQTRVGTQSVTARPMCRFNWNACTTILKGRRFFRNVLTDGPISRINFCTIPEQEIGAEQPIYGQYDAEFDEALKPYIDNLVAARGLIDCPQAYKLAKKLLKECAEFAQMSQNDTWWNLSHRACVIAWLKACVLYVANGQKWEKSIDDFIRWSLNYDMYCKMIFFGNRIEAANNTEDSRIGTRGPRNLLELLPDVFTLDDAKRVRQQQGISNEGYSAIRMIRTWINRDYVIQNTEYSFQKREKFKNRNL